MGDELKEAAGGLEIRLNATGMRWITGPVWVSQVPVEVLQGGVRRCGSSHLRCYTVSISVNIKTTAATMTTKRPCTCTRQE